MPAADSLSRTGYFDNLLCPAGKFSSFPFSYGIMTAPPPFCPAEVSDAPGKEDRRENFSAVLFVFNSYEAFYRLEGFYHVNHTGQ